MILFERQQIIGTLLANLAGNLLLRIERIDCDDTSFYCKQSEQFRHGSDLVGFFVHFDLAQGQAIAGRPGAHQMHCSNA